MLCSTLSSEHIVQWTHARLQHTTALAPAPALTPCQSLEAKRFQYTFRVRRLDMLEWYTCFHSGGVRSRVACAVSAGPSVNSNRRCGQPTPSLCCPSGSCASHAHRSSSWTAWLQAAWLQTASPPAEVPSLLLLLAAAGTAGNNKTARSRPSGREMQPSCGCFVAIG